MAQKILPKKELGNWLEGLAKDSQLWVPKREGLKVQWAGFDGEGMELEFINTHLSPKHLFFPQTECMMSFINDPAHPQGMIMTPTPPMEGTQVVVGVRPCDAAAFSLLDRIFCQDEYTDDPYWRDKREKTTLVGLACNRPGPYCFCTSVGGSPHGTTGLDVLMVDVGEELVLNALTDKGKALIEGLKDAPAEAVDKAAELKSKAEGAMEVIDTSRITKKSVMELYEQPFWEEIATTCLNCGTCTFCCPTCHCFDIQDEVMGLAGRRVRNWDWCMSWLFTQHGSGHNPRPTKTHRVRQRFMHKFSYIPIKRDGIIGCVGCGRCVELCPVNIDVREVIKLMNS